MLELIRMSSSMVSPYKAQKIGVKHFLGYLVYELFLWPKSWPGSLYIYLLSFPRFWTLSVEWFWFLFWSILNGVTLKTSNNFLHPDQWTSRNEKLYDVILFQSANTHRLSSIFSASEGVHKVTFKGFIRTRSVWVYLKLAQASVPQVKSWLRFRDPTIS